MTVAARLEGLAEPGGICISGSVHEQVRNRIEAVYEDRGEQEVKNVSAPVRVYAIRLGAPAADLSSVEQEIANKPSIAVLPFDNLSGDPDQDFIGDGLTEDIITGLSRIRQFFVIARNSTFQYKGTSPDLRRVAKDLGVRYVVEGSVRQASKLHDATGVISPTVNDHSGRIVKLTGDGFLAEFPTVHEAVKCGIAMQEGFADSSLEFRIGINLGDIIDDG